MKKSAADQATHALRETVPSETARSILAALRSEITSLDAERAKAAESSLDPLISDADANKLRATAGELQFQTDRLRRLDDALAKRAVSLADAEAAAAQGAERDAAAAERDALAADIAEIYPRIVAEMTSLAQRIIASDARVEKAGAGLSAECIARGYQANLMWPDRVHYVARITGVKLPLFDRRGLGWESDMGGRLTFPGLAEPAPAEANG